MPNYLSPGVYVEEVQAASRPIEGVGTAVAAFVGLAQKGPANTPVMALIMLSPFDFSRMAAALAAGRSGYTPLRGKKL